MRKLIYLLLATSLSSVPSLLLAKTIKIGLAGPLSGPYASFGEQLLQGATAAAADINKQGGINGDTIEIVKADDQCDPKQAITVANRLVSKDKVYAVIGHFCSSATIPASQVYADAQLLMITPSSTNPIITERNLKTIFRSCGRDDQQGPIAADFIHNQLKATRVAVLQDGDTYGKGLAEATKDRLQKLGVEIALDEGITRGEKDFSRVVNKIKESKADAVYFGGLHTEAAPLLKELRTQGIKIPFIAGDGIVSESFVTEAGGPQMIENVYMTFGADPRILPESKNVVEQFRHNGYEPEGYTLYSYATLQAIAQAMKQTPSLSGKKLADWLHEHKVHTVMGDKSWNKSGDLTTADYIMYQWDNTGKYFPTTLQ